MPKGTDIPTPKAKPGGQGQRTRALWLITLAALVLGSFVLVNLAETLATYRWTKVPCTILSSRITEYTESNGQRSFTLDIRYEYEVDGRKLQGTSYNDRGATISAQRHWSDYSEVTREFQRYPEGSRTVCFVKPGEP